MNVFSHFRVNKIKATEHTLSHMHGQRMDILYSVSKTVCE